MLDEAFAPRALPTEPFANSLGVNTGPAEEIVIAFAASAAGYVRERDWHRSQRIEERADGSLILTLEVCNDYALRAWILGFGPEAQVVSPDRLARDIEESAHLTWRNYTTARRRQHTRVLSARAS